MVKHVVLMKFKPDVKEKQISQVKNGLGSLPDTIIHIKEVLHE